MHRRVYPVGGLTKPTAANGIGSGRPLLNSAKPIVYAAGRSCVLPHFTLHYITQVNTMNRILAIKGHQAGKVFFTGVMKGSEILSALKNCEITVNEHAQRTLAKGADAKPTHQLLDEEKVHETPRMKDFVKFLQRVMDKIKEGDVSEGFLGAVLTVIPEGFINASWASFNTPEDARDKVGMLVLEDAGLGQPALHIGDGQGRFFALYSLEYTAKVAIQKIRKELDRKRKAKQDVGELEVQLREADEFLKDVQQFLRGFSLTIVCYAKEIQADGKIVGLGDDAERRLYIEGNALNSRASKEQQLRFDSISPIGVALHELRTMPEAYWMDQDYIEEDSKSIAKASSKLFTLSTLTQAYGLSVANTTKTQSLDPEVFERVGDHKEFAAAYWTKISQVFEPLWKRPEELSAGEWLEFLGKNRREQNVAYQAIFLQALGRLGHLLGKKTGWIAESDLLDKLEKLSPDEVDYRAFIGDFTEDGDQVVADSSTDFNSSWTNAMMKPRGRKDNPDLIEGYTFNNVSDSISKTYYYLAKLVGVDVDESASDVEDATNDKVALLN